MICPKCGIMAPDNAGSCLYCGVEFQQVQASVNKDNSHDLNKSKEPFGDIGSQSNPVVPPASMEEKVGYNDVQQHSHMPQMRVPQSPNSSVEADSRVQKSPYEPTTEYKPTIDIHPNQQLQPPVPQPYQPQLGGDQTVNTELSSSYNPYRVGPPSEESVQSQSVVVPQKKSDDKFAPKPSDVRYEDSPLNPERFAQSISAPPYILPRPGSTDAINYGATNNSSTTPARQIESAEVQPEIKKPNTYNYNDIRGNINNRHQVQEHQADNPPQRQALSNPLGYNTFNSPIVRPQEANTTDSGLAGRPGGLQTQSHWSNTIESGTITSSPYQGESRNNINNLHIDSQSVGVNPIPTYIQTPQPPVSRPLVEDSVKQQVVLPTPPMPSQRPLNKSSWVDPVSGNEPPTSFVNPYQKQITTEPMKEPAQTVVPEKTEQTGVSEESGDKRPKINLIALLIPVLLSIFSLFLMYSGVKFIIAKVTTPGEHLEIYNGIARVYFDEGILGTFSNETKNASPRVLAGKDNAIVLTSQNSEVETTFNIIKTEEFNNSSGTINLGTLTGYLRASSFLEGASDVTNEKNTSKKSTGNVVLADGRSVELIMNIAKGKTYTIFALSVVDTDRAQHVSVKDWLEYVGTLKVVDDSVQFVAGNLIGQPFNTFTNTPNGNSTNTTDVPSLGNPNSTTNPSGKSITVGGITINLKWPADCSVLTQNEGLITLQSGDQKYDAHLSGFSGFVGTPQDFLQQNANASYESYESSEYYENLVMTEIRELLSNSGTMHNYVKISYNTSSAEFDEAYIAVRMTDDILKYIRITSRDAKITEDYIKQFLD